MQKLNPNGGAPRRLYKSQTDRMLAGVCGGVADYLNIDPTLIRLGFVLLTLFNGAGLVIYIVMAFLVPHNASMDRKAVKQPQLDLSWLGTGIALAIGVGLILFGFGWMMDRPVLWILGFWELWSWLKGLTRFFWGLVVIAIGGLIVMSALKRR